jgi:hypothetical protein
MSTAEETILTIRNEHIEACGKPPVLSTEGKYTCYFDNVYGEQNIMQFDPNTKICQLWMGDVGWEEELRVEEFRGRVVVKFARTKAERDTEFKMNKQFQYDLPEASPETKLEIKKQIYAFMRKAYGKSRLTDAECQYLSEMPTLNQEELEVIRAFWKICKRVAE